MSRWRCRRYRTLLVDGAEGVLSDQQRQRLDRHLRSCAACAQALAALQEIPTLLQDAAVPDPEEDFWRQQRQAVGQAIRNLPLPRARAWAAVWPDSWRLRPWRHPLAVTASLLVALLVYRFAMPVAPPSPTAERDFAALDSHSLAAVREVMRALEPADAQLPQVEADDDAVLAALPFAGYGATGELSEVPQANDLSEPELDKLGELVGDDLG